MFTRRVTLKNIWVPLSGAIAQQRNVEVIANNVANINTPGFKKDQLVFKEYLTAFDKGTDDIDMPRDEWRPSDYYKSYGSEHSQVRIDGNYTIHDQGQLSMTNNPLDLGLRGPGFFEVLSPNGIRYTRAGSFSISGDGFLVNANGHPVLAKLDLTQIQGNESTQENPLPKPDERKIKLTPGKISINFQGEIFSNENKIGQLSIVEFNDIHALKKEGNSLFINPDKNNINPEISHTIINQGFVEGSNVNAIQEMSALIKANRQFETIQRAIKAYDSVVGNGINEISNF